MQAYKVVRTNPVIVGKPANFFINGTAKAKSEGGTPTPFTIVDLLPEALTWTMPPRLFLRSARR